MSDQKQTNGFNPMGMMQKMMERMMDQQSMMMDMEPDTEGR